MYAAGLFLLPMRWPILQIGGLLLMLASLFLWMQPRTAVGQLVVLATTSAGIVLMLSLAFNAVSDLLGDLTVIFAQLGIVLTAAYLTCLAAHLAVFDYFNLRISWRVFLPALTLMAAILIPISVLGFIISYFLPVMFLRLMVQAVLMTFAFVTAVVLFREHRTGFKEQADSATCVMFEQKHSKQGCVERRRKPVTQKEKESKQRETALRKSRKRDKEEYVKGNVQAAFDLEDNK